MGCSPSQAVFIQSSTTSHDTICLQPTIYMVSESTVKLLQDVGELKVFNVDDSDHTTTQEKYGFAEDQLVNPLHYQPQVRSWPSNACSILDKAILSGSKTTIHSQQSLTASDSDGFGEDKFRITVEERATNDCEPEKKTLSEPREMQPNDPHETQTGKKSSVVADKGKLRNEQIEDNPNRSGSKIECSSKIMDLSCGKTKTDIRSRFIELRGKEPFDMLTPVECVDEMVNRSIRFKTAEHPEDTINLIARNKTEQNASNFPDNFEQEPENGNTVVAGQENDHDDKQTDNVADALVKPDMLMNSNLWHTN